jgi:hypothetical protein
MINSSGPVTLAEIRSIDLRHDGSLPDARCGGWVELYSDPWGWSMADKSVDRSLMFDYLDRGKDDWGVDDNG